MFMLFNYINTSSSTFVVVFLISGLNRARLADEFKYGFGLEKSGSGRAQHLWLIDNYIKE